MSYSVVLRIPGFMRVTGAVSVQRFTREVHAEVDSRNFDFWLNAYVLLEVYAVVLAGFSAGWVFM